MHRAYVIYPSDLDSPFIECDDCGIKYSKEDYQTLFDSKKIVYFYVPAGEGDFLDEEFTFDVILCYSCLFKYLKKVTNETKEPITVLIVDKGTGYKITVDPQDINDNDFDDWMGSIGEDDKGDEDNEEMDEDDGWDDGDYDFLDPPK